jgi:protein-tyrosine phosphatase
MAAYELCWITENLALGHAPMSYAELDSIRSQGIRAIVNLCAEFDTLHKIQEEHGFEVYYLPTRDHEAPALAALEEALDWLDESVYLGKKVLVHCRLGIGRTGTFVTAYLLRKGFGLKLAKREVEKTRASFSSFPQWRLLRKYHKASGRLTIREPSLESQDIVDLSPFFLDHEALLGQVDQAFQRAASTDKSLLSCGKDTQDCCYHFLQLQLVEAAYLNNSLNKSLKRSERQAAIERAVWTAEKTRAIQKQKKIDMDRSADPSLALREFYREERILCPLNVDAQCIAYEARPLSCRLYGLPVSLRGRTEIFGKPDDAGQTAKPQLNLEQVRDGAARTSRNMFYALTASFPAEEGLTFTLADTVSGKFVQQYFDYLAKNQV